MREKKPILKSRLSKLAGSGFQASHASKEEMPEQQTPEAPEFNAINGASILLAEDSLLLQEVIKLLLERLGAKVVTANNGEEALSLVRRESFDCVLMDIQMPEMDGLEATRLLRAEPATVGLRVIAISADSGQEERDRCFAAGMDDFIEKPFSAMKLFTMITKWLPQPLHGNAAGQPAHPDESQT